MTCVSTRACSTVTPEASLPIVSYEKAIEKRENQGENEGSHPDHDTIAQFLNAGMPRLEDGERSIVAPAQSRRSSFSSTIPGDRVIGILLMT